MRAALAGGYGLVKELWAGGVSGNAKKAQPPSDAKATNEALRNRLAAEQRIAAQWPKARRRRTAAPGCRSCRLGKKRARRYWHRAPHDAA